MNHIKNLSGQKFGKLTAISRILCRYTEKTLWKCVCDCGDTTNVIMQNLTSGNTKSCGCYISEALKARMEKKRCDVTSKHSIS